jgi:anti-sigma factor RsiW
MITRLLARWRFMRDHLWTGVHLSPYLDRELGEAEAARIERHTQVCTKCHRMLVTLRSTLEGLRGMSRTGPAPVGLVDAVVERLRVEQ